MSRCDQSRPAGPENLVARETNLTPAAVTTLIDRLEKRGFVSRQPDPDDRRKVMVAAGKKTEELVRRCYHPILEAGAALLENIRRPRCSFCSASSKRSKRCRRHRPRGCAAKQNRCVERRHRRMVRRNAGPVSTVYCQGETLCPV
ncbi:MarR family transcriptional regulator [Mesorhizobium sp. M0317]|uniref:MarR family transcriptional regulator n=1 Tax=Mesorhizobium sp. M0317 TaxID=2956935 RepID=UPI0033356566